jgi:hypothetical protein
MMQKWLQELLRRALLRSSLQAILYFLDYLDRLIPELEKRIKTYYSEKYGDLDEE